MVRRYSSAVMLMSSGSPKHTPLCATALVVADLQFASPDASGEIVSLS
jgi:hypothetical protein